MLANGHTNCSARGLSELDQTNTDGWPNLNSLELESGSLKLDTAMHCVPTSFAYVCVYVRLFVCMCHLHLYALYVTACAIMLAKWTRVKALEWAGQALRRHLDTQCADLLSAIISLLL